MEATSLLNIYHRKSRDVIVLRVHAESLERLDLTEAYLHGASLTGQRCAGVNFRRAHLVGADLTGCDLRDAVLAEAQLDGAYLVQADLTGADLAGACLRKATMYRAVLCRANLCGVDFTDAILDGVDLRDVRYDGQTRWPSGFEPPASASDARLRARELEADGEHEPMADQRDDQPAEVSRSISLRK